MNDIVLAYAIIGALFTALALKPIIHKFQSCGYSAACFELGYFDKKYLPYFSEGVFGAGIYTLVLTAKSELAFTLVFLAVYFILFGVHLYFGFKKKHKQPLVYTPRAVRLYTAAVIVTVAVMLLGATYLGKLNAYFAGVCCVAAPAYAPATAWLALLFTLPFEWLNNKRYLIKTKRLLDNPCLIKIAVTGSFGKTSVKNILKAMLSSRYNVVATEGNYNTPLGIAKSTSRIDNYTEVFIAEFGARKTGDIAELMRLVAPKYGVLTGVTSQHLETFKTLDNIYDEKLKLVFGIPSDGAAIVNRNGLEREIALPENASFVGGADDCVFAKDIRAGKEGSTFALVFENAEYQAKTKLLGAHNVNNIVSAAALAYKLKVAPEKIVKAIAALPEIPHRLRLIKNGGITVIDDTYNANPVGVGEALAVLKQFDGRKIVVTPGMVELGEREEAENLLFGCKLAAVANLVILIGKKRADDIQRGLLDGGFSAERIKRYATLADAERDFPRLFSAGDTVMFINDLPEKYF